MRRGLPLLVLFTAVMASLPGFSLPARTAAAAPIKPSCQQQLNQCLKNATAQLIACQIAERPGCQENYDAAKKVCQRNFQLCLIFGN